MKRQFDWDAGTFRPGTALPELSHYPFVVGTKLADGKNANLNMPRIEVIFTCRVAHPAAQLIQKKEKIMNSPQVFPGFGLSLIIGFGLLAIVTLLWPGFVSAIPEGSIGRYQISSWASYAGARVHHSGYYIIDTATGQVVDRGHEIHGIDDPGK
jgi:hypothetical protein